MRPVRVCEQVASGSGRGGAFPNPGASTDERRSRRAAPGTVADWAISSRRDAFPSLPVRSNRSATAQRALGQGRRRRFTPTGILPGKSSRSRISPRARRSRSVGRPSRLSPVGGTRRYPAASARYLALDIESADIDCEIESVSDRCLPPRLPALATEAGRASAPEGNQRVVTGLQRGRPGSASLDLKLCGYAADQGGGSSHLEAAGVDGRPSPALIMETPWTITATTICALGKPRRERTDSEKRGGSVGVHSLSW